MAASSRVFFFSSEPKRRSIQQRKTNKQTRTHTQGRNFRKLEGEKKIKKRSIKQTKEEREAMQVVLRCSLKQRTRAPLNEEQKKNNKRPFASVRGVGGGGKLNKAVLLSRRMSSFF